MADIWLVLPTANVDQCGRCFMHWRAMGYKTAALANGPAFNKEIDNADLVVRAMAYPGWGASVNSLAKEIFATTDTQWIVGAGDDMLPDPTHAPDRIAADCTEHFSGTFGVMQPAGDPWPGNAFDICGSPWIGREFAKRWNEGRGAFWPDYYHEYADEELCVIAKQYGLLWQRADLIQKHEHWTRHGTPQPKYMHDAYAMKRTDQELYKSRRRADFPGHTPVPTA